MAKVQDVQQLKLAWETRRNAPCAMRRGAAVAHGSVGYFSSPGSCDVFAYDSEKDDWSTLPECPQIDFGLAVVNNLLTAVGGLSAGPTNRLVSFNGSKWVTIFPPMPTKQYYPVVISAQNYLIAAGGWGVGGTVYIYTFLSTVEVMNIATREWYTAASLPEPVSDMSATVCGGRLYLLGGWDKNNYPTRAVFTCTLDSLLHSCHPPSQTLPHTNEASVWQRIADVPMEYSTCTTLNGRVLAVGGEDSHGTRTADVYMYNGDTDSWPLVGHMSTARYECLVVGLRDCVIVVGGSSMNSSVEVGYLQLSDGGLTADPPPLTGPPGIRQSVLGPKIMPSFNPAEARSKLEKSTPVVRWKAMSPSTQPTIPPGEKEHVSSDAWKEAFDKLKADFDSFKKECRRELQILIDDLDKERKIRAEDKADFDAFKKECWRELQILTDDLDKERKIRAELQIDIDRLKKANSMSLTKYMSKQQTVRSEDLIHEFEVLMTDQDGLLGVLEDTLQEYGDEANYEAKKLLCALFQDSYDNCKEAVIHHVSVQLYKHFAVQSKKTKEMEELSRGYGLLLLACGLKTEEMRDEYSTEIKEKLHTLFVVQSKKTEEMEKVSRSYDLLLSASGLRTEEMRAQYSIKIKEKIYGKLLSAKTRQKVKETLDSSREDHLGKVIELTWKFVTLPNPLIVCQPKKFDPQIHDPEHGHWDSKCKDELVYTRSVVYRNYKGALACEGWVANTS